MGEGSSVLYAAREPAAKGALVAPLGWSWGRTEESDMLNNENCHPGSPSTVCLCARNFSSLNPPDHVLSLVLYLTFLFALWDLAR